VVRAWASMAIARTTVLIYARWWWAQCLRGMGARCVPIHRDGLVTTLTAMPCCRWWIGSGPDASGEYILGARLRRQKEVNASVLASRPGRGYQEVAENLAVKEVWVDGRRYIVCLNPDEAAKDAAEREAIVKALEDELRQGVRQLVGNRGYRRFLRVDRDAVTIDMKKVAAEAHYDGKFVLRTNTSLLADEVAVRYPDSSGLVSRCIGIPRHQVAPGHQAHLPPSRRAGHPGPCLLFLPGPGAHGRTEVPTSREQPGE